MPALKQSQMGEMIIGAHTYGRPIRRGDMNSIIIGKYCSIAENVRVDGGWSHNADNISTYPFHAWGAPGRWPNNNVCKGDIVIGNDVWIGEGAIIMSGVTIGDGAVIGAASIISKDVNPYEVMVGNNRWIRDRFNTLERIHLGRMKWWDWTDQQVEGAVPILHTGDIDDLLEYYNTKVVNNG